MIHITQHGPVRGFRLARTLMGKGRYYTGCFFVDGLLIDSGCALTVAELGAALAGEAVHTVVNTHHHEDHVGANLAFAQRGAAVLASELACPIINGGATRPPLMAYQRVLWGWPEKSPAAPLGEWLETDHHRFQIIATPGHSPDHVCLYEPNEGWLFCGDAYVGGKDRGLRLGYDIWGIIASLKKMAALDLNLIFTGSGSLVENPAQALAEKIDYLEYKGRMVLEYHRRGFGVRQIRKMVFGGHQAIYYFTQGDFSGEHLVMSYLEGEAGE
jgi:glyoxylase-like metal-dependent hydrolase (beta-lactamase superfamily II)